MNVVSALRFALLASLAAPALAPDANANAGAGAGADAAAGTRASTPEPMQFERLIELHEAGFDDEIIVQLASREGLAEPLGSAHVLALREAGLSPALVSRLVLLSLDEGISIEDRDGITVITGEGPVPLTEESDESESRGSRDDWEDEPRLGAAPPPQVIVVGAAPAAQVAAPSPVDESTVGHPAGAVFGWSGGAVFLPARFGGSEPSAFGRTIVGFTGQPQPGCCPPVLAPAPPPVVEPTSRMIPVRTSRGELWIPN